ncbi:alpha/beta fold hydrolase, partial [Pseudomonas aeruginosa]|uniref:alpha/beta fold hydrolase n=1 Tax=Pseudomonas aeruginosa TaxID=287 RepID=UPI0026756E0C
QAACPDTDQDRADYTHQRVQPGGVPLQAAGLRDDRQQLLLQAARSYDRAFNPEGVQRQLLAILAEPSRVPLLNRLQVPTLVIHGTADPLLPVMHGVHVAAHIRGSELKLIPGLAHRFQEAFKEPLLAAVVPYLKAHRQASVVQL